MRISCKGRSLFIICYMVVWIFIIMTPCYGTSTEKSDPMGTEIPSVESFISPVSPGGGVVKNIEEDTYEQYKSNIPDDVISVTLPTSGSFYTPFTIDPQGALCIQEDGDEFIPEAIGAVVPNAILSVRNTSSVAVSVIVDAYVTKNLDTGEPASVKLRTDPEGLDQTKNNELFLNMYATGNITDAELDELRSSKRDYTLKDDARFVHHVNIASNGRAQAMEICFHLKEASYQMAIADNKNILILDEYVSDNYSQAAFCVGGMASQKSNWGRFLKSEEEKIALQLVFSIVKYDEDMSDKVEIDSCTAVEPTYFSDGVVYNLEESSDNRNVEMRHPYLIDETLSDLKLPVDLGKGAKRIQITDVSIIQGEEHEMKLSAGVDYDMTVSGITLKASADNLWSMRSPAVCVLALEGRSADGENVRLEAAFSTEYVSIEYD